MNQDNVNFQGQNNNNMFNNQSQQNQNIVQTNNIKQSEFNNNSYQQSTNQNNILYNKTDNKKQNNKVKIIIISIVLIIVVLICIKIFFGCAFQSKSIKIKNDYTDINLSVENVERNVKLHNSKSNKEENFTKIKISIVNNKQSDFSGILISYALFDQNKKELKDSNCINSTYFSASNYDKDDITDFVTSTIPANSKATGYLYCKEDNKNIGKILGIAAYTAFDEKLIKEGQIKSTDSEIFYIPLK